MRQSEIEQIKLLANALNNIGVATIVAGGVAPGAATLLGTTDLGDPWRLSSVVVICIGAGTGLFAAARRV